MQKNKPKNVIVDTNIWISFVISNKLTLLDSLVYADKIRFLFSKELIEEINSTTTKPKLKKYFQSNTIVEMLSAFEEYIDMIEVISSVLICRDPKDNFLLGLAKDGKADFLITGDKDLLDLGKTGKTIITTITDFLKMFD